MSLDWPSGWERTPTRERSRNRNFEVSLGTAIDDLEAEMRRLDVDEWRLSTALDHQSQNPNRPYANQPEPEDPGVVVRWTMDGEQFAVACDEFSRARDNLRSVGLYVREKRKMSTRPVVTGEAEFANARLPPGDESNDVVVAGSGTSEAPHEVLGVAPDAPEPAVKGAARQLKAEAHPDAGGSREKFERIVEAEEALLEGGSA